MHIQSPTGGRSQIFGFESGDFLHLGHLVGALDNWVRLQDTHECFYVIVDWHALTTDYADTSRIPEYVRGMAVDWLSAGIDPERSAMFVQSAVKEHAELHLLLSVIVPLPWLERVPTYKDQMDQLKDRDLGTYGFLGYPLLQSADILLYRAHFVPVGEDQVAHVEITREVARRFNHLFGREPDIELKIKRALKQLGSRTAAMYDDLRRQYQEQGDWAMNGQQSH